MYSHRHTVIGGKKKKDTYFGVYSEHLEILHGAFLFTLGKDIFEAVHTPFQQLFRVPKTELLWYLNRIFGAINELVSGRSS